MVYSEPPRQMPFQLPVKPAMGADDFVVTPANRTAWDAINAWPEWPSPITMLVADPGAGKTHLATIWATQAQAEWCNGQDLSTLQRDNAAPLVIDDVQDAVTHEDQLFHALNTWRSTARPVLITSTRSPDLLGFQRPDTVSRLRAATIIHLDPPDEALFQAMLAKQLSDRQIDMDTAVMRYVGERLPRDTHTLAQFVSAIDSLSLEKQRALTKPLVAEVLRQMNLDIT